MSRCDATSKLRHLGVGSEREEGGEDGRRTRMGKIGEEEKKFLDAVRCCTTVQRADRRKEGRGEERERENVRRNKNKTQRWGGGEGEMIVVA